MKKIILCFLLFSIKSFAQDPTFSQTYANPLYINPAFAGTATSQNIGVNFRDQWQNIPGSFTTYNLSYNRNIIDSSTGLGILANRDEAGQSTFITDNISLIFSHQFHIKSFTLSWGIQYSYQTISIDWSKLTFGDMIDATRGFVYTSNELASQNSVSFLDISTGILGYGKHYFIGFSVDHLTQPNESFVTGSSPLPIKYTLNAGGMVNVGSFIISPTILYQEQQDFNQTLMECYVSHGHFTIGAGARLSDALIFTVGFQNKFFRIGYSYDYTTSSLTNQTGGTHEASLAYLLKYKLDKLKKVNGINCPFF